jgi:hypothetical protein
MRTLALAALLLAQTSAAEYQLAAPMYELPPCGEEPAHTWAVLPDGQYVHIKRIESISPTAVRLVGYNYERIFCDTLEGTRG